jgi:plastocyanin/spore coat polysaccharide biosynthesis protein SpsF (cytidylyltransferase family)
LCLTNLAGFINLTFNNFQFFNHFFKMKKLLLAFVVLFAAFMRLDAQIVISEIMFNPPEAGSDTLEYIELHNPGTSAVNMEGYILVGADLIFPSVSIPPGGFLLTAFRAGAMQSFFNVAALQWTTGNLSNGGEAVKLLNPAGALVDSVRYDDVAPWPTDAAGNGYSVELCDANANNADAAFWKASPQSTGVTINNKLVYGTPGAANAANCAPDADFIVTVQNFSFTPADITISQGQSVRWDNAGGNHNINGSIAAFPSNPEGFSNGVPSSLPWNFIHVFNVPGVYNYRCDPHANSGMVGKVTVIPTAIVDVVITEISYNDPGSDSLEFVEILNHGSATVDMSGWNFTQGIEHVFPAGATLGAGQYLVLAKYPDYFAARFGFTPEVFLGSLANVGEDIELRTAIGDVVDYVDYKPDGAWPVNANGLGSTLVLCDPSADNSLPASWVAATTPANFAISGVDVLANPNAASGCPTNVMSEDDQITVISGGTISIPVLANDFIPAAVASLTIIAQPAHGTVTVSPDNTIVYVATGGYCGSDFFGYQVCSGGSCDMSTVTVTVKCYPVYNIGQVIGEDATGYADSTGVFCELQGTVHGVNLRPAGLIFSILDAPNNRGITIFRNTGNYGYTVTEGDKIKVRGKIEQFNGLTQMSADTVIKVSSNNPLVTPLTVLKHAEATENQLIKIKDLRLINPAEWTTGMGASGFTAKAVSDANLADTIFIRIDNDVTLYNAPAPSSIFNITGLGGQFDNSAPFTSGYQITPRYDADLDLMIATKEANFSQNVQFSPNPVANILNIRTDIAFDEIQIMDAMGRLVKQIIEPDQEETVDMQKMASGVYAIRFVKDNAFWTGRVVKVN